MPLEIPVEDIRQMYENSLVLHNNKPVYVQTVYGDGSVEFIDLLSQRTGEAPFTTKEFTPPTRRLGFINTLGSVVYAERVPVRRYKVGLTAENTKVSTLRVYYPKDGVTSRERIRMLQAPEIGDALFNRYPSFMECVEKLKKRKGACAFDKQFAVSHEGTIFYKTSAVGKVAMGSAKSTEDIKWNEGMEYLADLIGDAYAKSLRNSKKS